MLVRHSPLYPGSLPPGLSHCLCEAGHVAEKAWSQESTDGKAELKEGEVMCPGSYRWRGESQGSSPGSAVPPNASQGST